MQQAVWTPLNKGINLFTRSNIEAVEVLDPKIIDDLSKRLAGSLPGGINSMQADLERNLRSGLEAALSKLNLVTREEFEIQQAVLQRTREKLSALEAEIKSLEDALAKKD